MSPCMHKSGRVKMALASAKPADSPWIHEVDVAPQLRLDGRQLLHALLHLCMQLHSRRDMLKMTSHKQGHASGMQEMVCCNVVKRAAANSMQHMHASSVCCALVDSVFQALAPIAASERMRDEATANAAHVRAKRSCSLCTVALLSSAAHEHGVSLPGLQACKAFYLVQLCLL